MMKQSANFRLYGAFKKGGNGQKESNKLNYNLGAVGLK